MSADSVYQKKTKSADPLVKYDPYDDEDRDPSEGLSDEELGELGEGFREFSPEDEESQGEDWLKENDPQNQQTGDDYEEYNDGEDQETHQQLDGEGEEPPVEEARPESPAVQASQEAKPPQEITVKPEDSQEESEGKQGRFKQPSREDILNMRQYTRPWEQRARDALKLQADHTQNPNKAHEGGLIEAREKHHQDRRNAYQQLMTSDKYKNASPIEQMEMDENFEKDWHKNNPSHLHDFSRDYHTAHASGRNKKSQYEAIKDARIKDILGGTSVPEESMSTEEAMQHAGGVKGEEGTMGAMVKDPTVKFAESNPEFIQHYAKEYANKAKKVGNIDDMADYDESSKRDISRILGGAPAKDKNVDKFFEHYHPMIGMNASKVVKQLGLEGNTDIDMSMLHEAGMHGLMQAINDYDHDNPAKAGFSTHAGHKMRGLMMTALKNQDKIPAEIRRAQKKFEAGRATKQPATTQPVTAPKQPATTQPVTAPKQPDLSALPEGLRSKLSGGAQASAPAPAHGVKLPPPPKPVKQLLSHPAHKDAADRIARIDAHKALFGVKKPGGQTNE
jgi:DNA-directed RNA polymerase specialized sigma subunit